MPVAWGTSLLQQLRHYKSSARGFRWTLNRAMWTLMRMSKLTLLPRLRIAKFSMAVSPSRIAHFRGAQPPQRAVACRQQMVSANMDVNTEWDGGLPRLAMPTMGSMTCCNQSSLGMKNTRARRPRRRRTIRFATGAKRGGSQACASPGAASGSSRCAARSKASGHDGGGVAGSCAG